MHVISAPDKLSIRPRQNILPRVYRIWGTPGIMGKSIIHSLASMSCHKCREEQIDHINADEGGDCEASDSSGVRCPHFGSDNDTFVLPTEHNQGRLPLIPLIHGVGYKRRSQPSSVRNVKSLSLQKYSLSPAFDTYLVTRECMSENED